MATAQCAVRALTGLPFCGLESENELYLHVDTPTVNVGSVITGTVQVVGQYAHGVQVEMLLEGIEYCVVPMTQEQFERQERNGRNPGGIDFLTQDTTEVTIFLKNEMIVRDAENPSEFRFELPKDIPGTLRCVLDDATNRRQILPSQCQIKYHITATISNHGVTSKTTSQPIIVLPSKESDMPVDKGLAVSSAGSAMEVINRNLFSCGDGAAVAAATSLGCGRILASDTIQQVFPASTANEILSDASRFDFGGDELRTMKTPSVARNHIRLEASSSSLCLVAGKPLEIHVSDWFGQLKSTGVTWKIRLLEEITWKSQGRKDKKIQVWDLHANREELPGSLRRSFCGTLVSIRHELMVYLYDDSTKEVLASTETIPVLIVGNAHALEA